MTAVLLWKEYRQQRSVWLAIALLAILFVIILAATLGQGGGLQVFQEDELRGPLQLVVGCLIVSYGVVSGALLLAGESDEGTQVFLDTLTCRRGPLWARKCLAGVLLTLTLSLFLTGLAVGLGFGSWETALSLPLLGLDALAWGLLGGALCRKVMAAILIAIAFIIASWGTAGIFMTASWGVTNWLGHGLMFYLGKVATVGAASYVSWRYFSRIDRLRKPKPARVQGKAFFLFPAGRVLLWLVYRQGRWLLAGCVLVALFLSVLLQKYALVAWPVVTLLLGLICGLSAFAFDQKEGARFLGAQRFPPGKIWTAKILFWATALLGLTALAWCSIYVFHRGDRLHWWFYNWMDMRERLDVLDPLVFLSVCPLYGFCFGQFFGQVARRPILAVILSFFITPLVVALWLPSFLFGGLTLWQLLLVPALLLLLTRLSQWPCVSGRLLTFRPLAVIAGGVVLMVLALAAGLWYRVAEVPDVGEPFDVPAFTASLPSPEQNKVGPLFQRAITDMEEHRTKVDQKLPPLKGPLFPGMDNEQWMFNGSILIPRLRELLQDKGWPILDAELSRWLDRLFEGAWVKEAQQVARLPLGMVQDPRRGDRSRGFTEVSGGSQIMADLFVIRALQLQVQGDFRGALDHLETVLGLSRQVRTDASVVLFRSGGYMETIARIGFLFWIHAVGPDRDLLQAALALWQRHDEATPELTNTIKVEYLLALDNDPTLNIHEASLAGDLLRMAYQVPWEKERQRRIRRASVAGLLRESQQPLWKNSAWTKTKETSLPSITLAAKRRGLPPETGPGSSLSVGHWNELLQQMEAYDEKNLTATLIIMATRQLQGVRAVQLLIAVALYQVNHKKAPDMLDILVPDYLPAIPDDPFTGQSFNYRVFAGEEIYIGGRTLKLPPGQALITSEDLQVVFPVPVWRK